MLIIPSILTNDIKDLIDLEKRAEGAISRVQLDVIDGKFAQNTTIDPLILKNIPTSLSFDFHLMVNEPIDWIDHCATGQNNRIIGQIEYMSDQKKFVEKVAEKGYLSGLGVDLATPVESLDTEALKKVNVVLLMSVPAGFGGQEFNLAVWDKLEKILKLKKELNLNFKICIDGGINKELANQMKTMGVDEIAIGRRIFEPDLKENLKLFNNS